MLLQVGNWGGGFIWRVTSGEFPSNTYICETAKNFCLLIDSGLDTDSISIAMEELRMEPTAVFCTHGHFDHVGSTAFFQKTYGIPVYLHGADHKLMKSSNFLLMALKLTSRIEQPSKITTVTGGDSFDVAGYNLIFHSTPGHTPGSCIIELGRALFTGDTIFTRGVSLSSLPGEKPNILRQSILNFWPMLTAERFVYPGHGGCATGEEVRRNNLPLSQFLGIPYSTDDTEAL